MLKFASCKISRIMIIVITWGLTQSRVCLFVFQYWKKEPHNHIPILLFHKFKINLSIHSGRLKLITEKLRNLSESDWRQNAVITITNYLEYFRKIQDPGQTLRRTKNNLQTCHFKFAVELLQCCMLCILLCSVCSC